MASRSSNEEIIENLTKGLEETCIKSAADESPASSSNKKSNDDSSSVENNASCSDDEVGVENSNNITEKDEDYIDEESLKDRDAQLSSEEKENFLKESLRCKNDGNALFKAGDYLESVISYTEGLKLCPLIYTNERSVLYSNRAASKHKLGRKESAIQDCTKAIELNNNYVRAYLRRAVMYEETDKLDESLEDYKKILELDPGNKDALKAAMRLPDQINERNEKLKAEMMGKLKDLGNMVLRPFGLSTENFKLTKDPNSGGYSVNFVQNH